MKRTFYNMDKLDLENDIKSKVCLVERNTTPQGVTEVNPFAVARCERSDLVELAKEIQMADNFVRASACSKLQLIAEQVRFLQNQAQNILLDAKLSTGLHHAACNFRKQVGHIYFLYQRPSGQQYFSMLSPEDWNNRPPHKYIGAYRLEPDMSWTPECKIEEQEDELQLINKILDANQLNSLTYKVADATDGVEKMDSS